MRDVFLVMKEELESSYPETCKIPSREGGYIRVPGISQCGVVSKILQKVHEHSTTISEATNDHQAR